MITLIVVLILGTIAWSTRRRPGALSRRYVGFVLAGLGLLIWSSRIDAIRHGGDAVRDAVFYKHFLLWSALGILSAILGVIASYWCPDKLLKVSSILIGLMAVFLCSVNVFLPY